MLTELALLIARALALESDIMALKGGEIGEDIMELLDEADSAAGQMAFALRLCAARVPKIETDGATGGPVSDGEGAA